MDILNDILLFVGLCVVVCIVLVLAGSGPHEEDEASTKHQQLVD